MQHILCNSLENPNTLLINKQKLFLQSGIFAHFLIRILVDYAHYFKRLKYKEIFKDMFINGLDIQTHSDYEQKN